MGSTSTENFAMDSPTLPVITKYGTLTMMFRDPDEGYGRTSESSVALVTGQLTLRGVVVNISVELTWVKIFAKDGNDLPAPVTELRAIHGYSSLRREDRKEWDYKAKYAAEVGALWNTVIREAYEAHPELQAKAIYVRLERECAEVNSQVMRLEDELAAAIQKLAVKQVAVAAFLAEHPEL
jgi:hypothetical protein